MACETVRPVLRLDEAGLRLGRTHHRELAVRVGEMSSSPFTGFLGTTLGNAMAVTSNGAIADACMFSAAPSRAQVRNLARIS